MSPVFAIITFLLLVALTNPLPFSQADVNVEEREKRANKKIILEPSSAENSMCYFFAVVSFGLGVPWCDGFKGRRIEMPDIEWK